MLRAGEELQQSQLLFTPSTSPAVTSCGFCGSSRRIFLFGANSLLKDMAEGNSSARFRRELDAARRKTSRATWCGPG